MRFTKNINYIMLLNISIPFKEPVLIIALILIILLVAPIFFEKIRTPSIVGLLVCGALVGPHGLNLLSPELEFTILGTIGLHYLMFLTGLEIDIVDFIENKKKTIYLGLLSYVFPFIVGFFVCQYILNYNVTVSLLIAAMLSSHTLISYPILGQYGIVNKQVITIVIGGTIIADVLALVSMEVITDLGQGQLDVDMLLKLLLNFSLFFAYMLLLVPKLIKGFFRYYEGDINIQYIFILTLLFVSAVITELLHVEPIIGAFFTGIIMNKFIIRNSPLFKRVEFIGNTLFIPIFLISVGVLANFGVYIQKPLSIISLFVLIIAALLGKYLSALVMKWTYKQSLNESLITFGLSSSRAASAIAIMLVGYNMGFVNELIINHTVVLILVTCIFSSYLTSNAAKKIAFEDDQAGQQKKYKDRIVLPLAKPENMENLLEFSSIIKDADNETPIYPLSIITGKNQSSPKIQEAYKQIESTIFKLHVDTKFEIITRIDNTVTNGIHKAEKELMATMLIIGWESRKLARNVLFGSVLKNLLKKTQQMILVIKTPLLFKDIHDIHLFFPEFAEHEKGYFKWVDKVNTIGKRLKCKIISYGPRSTIENLKQQANKSKFNNFQEYSELKTFDSHKLPKKQSTTDLFIFITARSNTISYNVHYERMINNYSKFYSDNNLIFIYPEQGGSTLFD